MKPPIQSFDAVPMVRFRVRGTQDQIVRVHELLLQLAQETRDGRRGFTTALGTSGPASGDEQSKQWAMAFYASQSLMQRVRAYLLAMGLTEET